MTIFVSPSAHTHTIICAKICTLHLHAQSNSFMRDKTKAYSFPSSILICLHYWFRVCEFFCCCCCCCSPHVARILCVLLLLLTNTHFLYRYKLCVCVFVTVLFPHTHSLLLCAKKVFLIFFSRCTLPERYTHIYGYVGHYVMCLRVPCVIYKVS